MVGWVSLDTLQLGEWLYWLSGLTIGEWVIGKKERYEWMSRYNSLERDMMNV